MITLSITSWKKGLQTIALIKAVQEYSSSRSLLHAKQAVERLLDGAAIVLEFESEAKKGAFKRRAEELGAICD